MTPDQRLRVFVSSTLQELAAERAAASEAIAAVRLTPVLFELGARPHPPRTLYRAYLEQSQLFVGVYWQSYGWVGPGESISGIEDEYLLSEELPRLLYVKEPAPERERRLRELLGRITSEGSVSHKSFATPEELEELLARDLAIVLSERFHEAASAPEPPPTRAVFLPLPRTSFVGRESEIAEIEELAAAGTRLLTLTGPGGIGKTRLAVEAARRMASEYPDGTVFVPLDGLESPELVPAAIAEALGTSEPGVDPLTALAGHLRERCLLVVLDNFEHVIAAAPVVASLLDAAPELTLLVTSRELLRVSGEHEFNVPALSPESEAIALFLERATAARHAFELADEDLPLVTEICRRLDGVPLAIELAAPLMRLLTPAQLLARLRERLELRGARDAPARQRTLEAAIAWSYELLDPEEQAFFARLGVFHGSFNIEAAEQVAAHDADGDFLDLLSSLLDKSVVHRLPHLGETRFAMLRMIRAYALARLAEAGELEPTRGLLATYYLRLAAEAEDGLRSASQRQWKQTLDLEADNFRAALAWASETKCGAEIAALMRGVWLWFWLHGNLDECRRWVAQGLACKDGLDDRDHGWLVGLEGTFAVLEGEFEAGVEKLGEAESLLAGAGDVRGVGTMKLVHSFGAAPLVGEERAQRHLDETLSLFEELGDLWGIGTTLHAMTRLRVVYDRYEGAGDLFERAVTAVEAVGDTFGAALASGNLAMARLAAGDAAAARELMENVLERRRTEGITYAADDVLDIFARIQVAEGEYERASELLGAADTIRQRLRSPLWPTASERHRQLLDELSTALGASAFEAAYARGAAIQTDDVYDIAKTVGRRDGKQRPSRVAEESLTESQPR